MRFGDYRQTAHVIRMLVGNYHRINGFGAFSNGGQPFKGRFPAQSRVHQDAGSFGADESTVARAAACEDTDFDYGFLPISTLVAHRRPDAPQSTVITRLFE